MSYNQKYHEKRYKELRNNTRYLVEEASDEEFLAYADICAKTMANTIHYCERRKQLRS